MNKPKRKGTAAESAVVKYLRMEGFIHADRACLHGNADIGDVIGIPNVCIEVKNCKAIEREKWLSELEVEIANFEAHFNEPVIAAGVWRKVRGQSHPSRWDVDIPHDLAKRAFHRYPGCRPITVPGALFVEIIKQQTREVENGKAEQGAT